MSQALIMYSVEAPEGCDDDRIYAIVPAWSRRAALKRLRLDDPIWSGKKPLFHWKHKITNDSRLRVPDYIKFFAA